MNRNFSLSRSVFFFALVVSGFFAIASLRAAASETISLAGQWRFALDRDDVGTNENWFAKNLPDKIQLPGILEAQNYGDEISIQTPWVLSLYDHFWFLRADYAAYTNTGDVKVPFLCQPPRHYLGAAWYQRDFEIPKNWNGKRVVLFLERPHWKSTIWLDDKKIGSDISLCAPHEFDFGIIGGVRHSVRAESLLADDGAHGVTRPTGIAPGKHRLTIRVDNRMILPYRPDAHSVSDSLDDAWNGIVGKIELRATPPVWINDIQIFPHPSTQSITVKGVLGNATGTTMTNLLNLNFIPKMADGGGEPQLLQVVCESNLTTFEAEIHSGYPIKLWDEFNPELFELTVSKRSPDALDKTEWEQKRILFGFRDFHADGNQFILNSHPIYFRGTHDGGDFPLTGYPPTNVASWKKIIQTCKNYGLNHIRFHSWCPPEAAFEAADELGFYFQIECGMWNEINPGSPMEKMLYAETEKIIRAYGNHPSFMLLSASNEAHGNWKPVLSQWVKHFRAEDPRHLYTPDTGWSLIDSPGEPVNGGADYLAVGHVGPTAMVRGNSAWFGRDFGDSLRGVHVPVISHELGQWCAYPDFDVIKKFTGFMQPENYEIFRDSAAAHGVLNQDKNFAFASGKFQLECYKEEIEANLRTPGLDGFQLLDLHDYMGQGTALVGLLDTFWESKGYATPEEFKKFCNTVVPLARLMKRVFTTTDKFEVPVEIANFGETELANAVAGWKIADENGRAVAAGNFPMRTIPIGKNFALGKISADLSKMPAPAHYKLQVYLQDTPFTNDWNFWLYPAQISGVIPTNVFVTSSWDDAEKKLSAGGKVLFLPRNSDLDWSSPPLDRTPIFWNRLMNPNWSRMLGLWCDTNHPALVEFPTDENCDWQWTELLHNTRAVNLDHLPKNLQPIVSAIDDWNRNYKLGLIFEAKVGAGKLLVCSIDLNNTNPVAQQLRRSLLDYMAGKKFQPETEISLADFRSLHFDDLIMRKLGATIDAGGRNAAAAIDGDPNTFWSIGGNARGAKAVPFPHELKIVFPQPVAMNGIVLMPRQNDRDHLGDTREYKIETSDDGLQWNEVARGELASTWNPQQIRFEKTATAKEIKFTALSDFGNDSSTAFAEIAVMYAGPKLADENSGSIEFQRVRSTSTDVDEGTGKPARSKN